MVFPLNFDCVYEIFRRLPIDDNFNPICGISDKLEVLTLGLCSLANDVDFFDSFTNLKALNLYQSHDISSIALKKCFQNNQGILCFINGNADSMYQELIPLLPNLEKLGVYYDGSVMDLSFLSQIKSLRSLSIKCAQYSAHLNLNSLLSKWAVEIDLEELELVDLHVNRNTFEIISNFKQLKLLSIKRNNRDLYIYFHRQSNCLPN